MSELMHGSMENCCDDEWTLEIIEDEQQMSNSLHAPKASFFVLFEIILPDVTSELNEDGQALILHDNAPPDKVSPPLYLFYRQLKLPVTLQS